MLPRFLLKGLVALRGSLLVVVIAALCLLPRLPKVVMLGSGAADYEEAFRRAQRTYPAHVRAHVGFSVPLAHK